jgi:hypothetical protein
VRHRFQSFGEGTSFGGLRLDRKLQAARRGATQQMHWFAKRFCAACPRLQPPDSNDAG